MPRATVTHVPAGPRRVELVVILGALTAFAPLSIDMYLPAFPTLARELATDAATVQLSLAAFFLAFGGGQVLFGPISDRFGRRAPLFGSLALYIAASIGCALAPDIDTLIALRFVQGLGACAGVVIARAVVRDLFEKAEAARIYSALILIMGLAPMLAPVLGGKLLIWADWHAIFWFLTAVGAACLAAVALRMPETHKAEHIRPLHLGSILKTYGGLLCDKRFLAYALIGGFAIGGMFAYIAGSPFVFIEVFGLAPDDFGIVFGLNALGFVIVAQVNGRLVHRIEPAQLLSLGIVVQIAAAAALLATALTGLGGLPGFVVPLFVAISALGLVMPNTAALAMAPFPTTAGSASALMGSLQFGIAACAAAAMGAIHAENAVPVAAMILAGGVLAATVRWSLAPR
ncbi:MAG: Bcr/CflA family multidrug efflux MFS transporter [Proteobacteria bacterium]|nr:Bcr/CflA family multidrug efflux MFS transporter [Pseudomonadota bacterium]